VLILREARDQLEALHPRQSEVIRLRYIVGLTEDETASALGVSPETVKLDVRKAKAFLPVRLMK
jgi:RNA polymerase sigma factor (sigma-70 family)